MVTITDEDGLDRPLDVPLFRELLEGGTDAEKDALFESIAAASPNELAPFLQEICEPEICEHCGRYHKARTALGLATRFDSVRFARVLVQKGADHTVPDGDDGFTVLMIATGRDTTEVLTYFLQELNCTDIVNAQNHAGWTALHCGIDEPQAVELLLEHGADPNIRDDEGRTPLHATADYGNTQSAPLLLEYGADLSLTDYQKMNVMHHAVVHSYSEDVKAHTNFVQWLLDIGAEDLMLAKDQSGRTPLDEALCRRNNPMIDLLVHQYKTKIVAQEDELCLHWILQAAMYKKGKVALPAGTLTIERMLAFLTLFLSERPNLISAGDGTGALPLHIACRYPKTPIQLMELLVEHDPSTVSQADNAGNLPIHSLCVSRPSLHKVKYLLSREAASVAALNCQGCSAFAVASLASASVDVIWYLMKVDPVVALASLHHSS